MIQETRVQRLNNMPAVPGRYVLYWMQQSQRAEGNHALEYAIDQANESGLPVLVTFGLTDAYPEACARHYAFMLQGLSETAAALEDRGIRMVVRRGSPELAATELADEATMVVTDRGYLRHQCAWRRTLAEHAACAVFQVESDAVVPVEAASGREEYAARTLRPKLHRLLPEYLEPLRPRTVRHDSLGLRIESLDLSDPGALLDSLRVDGSVAPVVGVTGGAAAARARLARFLDADLQHYATLRNEPAEDHQSGLSPYLHFGQLGPLDVALAVTQRARGNEEAVEAFLEELIVRRELAINFVRHNPRYDTFDCLPEWAQATLARHAADPRPVLYTREDLERAGTHDPYWNAAMDEMRLTGRMHGYMRMYWGKKILEWSSDPREAFETALYLNNKYFLDGRDPNAYGNVAWLFGKHDRPWQERPVFGTVRYMNERGLTRKFDMDAYIRRIAATRP